MKEESVYIEREGGLWLVERELKRIEIFLNLGRWIRRVIDGRECRWESEGRGRRWKWGVLGVFLGWFEMGVTWGMVNGF
jgi:hypothetical protein